MANNKDSMDTVNDNDLLNRFREMASKGQKVSGDQEWSGSPDQLDTELANLGIPTQFRQALLNKYKTHKALSSPTPTPDPTPTPVICHRKVTTGQCVDKYGKVRSFRCHTITCSDGFEETVCNVDCY